MMLKIRDNLRKAASIQNLLFYRPKLNFSGSSSFIGFSFFFSGKLAAFVQPEAEIVKFETTEGRSLKFRT